MYYLSACAHVLSDAVLSSYICYRVCISSTTLA